MKRLLFLTYYFPPSGGPGVQRALKFARYLPAFGWEPTVLTVRPDHAAYPALDESLFDDVPVDLHVFRTAAWDPYAAYARLLGKEKQETVGVGFVSREQPGWKEGLARWVRANLFIPDARVGWLPFAFVRGSHLLRRQPFDAIMTSTPPHSAHLAAWMLSRRFGVPWLADFRDPWTDISYLHDMPRTEAARKLDLALEKAVLRSADGVVAVGDSLARLLSGKAGRRVDVIHNGYDEEDFAGLTPEALPDFTIVHTGNLAASQNPVALWQALSAARAQGGLQHLRLVLVGNTDAAVLEGLRAHGLQDCLTLVPYLPHREAIRYMMGASLLMLSIPNVPDADGIITGKIFEYLASGRPVLGVGPVPGDAEAITARAGAGQFFAYDDAAGIESFVGRHHAAWLQGAPLPGAPADAAGRYSRKREAGLLAERLQGMASAYAAGDRAAQQ